MVINFYGESKRIILYKNLIKDLGMKSYLESIIQTLR